MSTQLDRILETFRSHFERYATFTWFVVVIVGFYVCVDHDGLTSMVRWLSLCPSCYAKLTHFFYATSWHLETLMPAWITWVQTMCPVLRFNDRALLIGDTIKVTKEGRKMPGVKALHQESGNNSKKAVVWGHHYGVVGLVTGVLAQRFCTPLQAQLHEGVAAWRPSEGLNGMPPTVVTRMARLLLATADQVGCRCYAALDAYYAVGPTFLILKERLMEDGTPLVHLSTRAKKSVVAYFVPDQGEKRFRKADKIKLMDLFERRDAVDFQTAQVSLYGQTTTIAYTCLNLLWEPVDGMLRFVLVEHGKRRFILMSSDLSLDPLTILNIYSLRTKIEVLFKTLKHQLGAFSYHFWTRSQPKLSRKKDWKPEVAGLSNTAHHHIRATLTAAERFVNLALIAIGILQYLSLTFPREVWTRYAGWLRTYSAACPSERVVKNVITTEFISRPREVRHTGTFQRLWEKRRHEKAGSPSDHTHGFS
jgi:hypothetical protein